MANNDKEKKMKRLLITVVVAGAACISLVLVHYHHQGQENQNGRRLHFLTSDSAMDSAGWEDDVLSSPAEELLQTQNEEAKLTYIGLETVSSLLGDDRYQEFKIRFEEFLKTNGTEKCSQVTLASPDVISDQTQITCYLQTDDEDKSIYQFIYRYGDDSYTFMEVDEIPEVQLEMQQAAAGADTQDPSGDQTGENQTGGTGNNGTNSQTQTGAGNVSDSSQSSNTSPGNASAETSGETYHTVNGVQFENMDIYETLSEKAVDLFTKDVAEHWSLTGEDRRLIRTTVPEKNGSKVTFTCTFPDDGDSFLVTLDLNRETFSYS